jgi:3-dehydroquinate dehydratase-2
MSARILVLHGPNLNLLGTREPEIYGKTTLVMINEELHRRATAHGVALSIMQTNHEGECIEAIHAAQHTFAGIIINPGGYTHTSVAIADALKAVALPAIEVHLSNLYNREAFRRRSFTGAVCSGSISGFGARSYYVALDALVDLLADADPRP